jgi:ankyrin repeat protein
MNEQPNIEHLIKNIAAGTPAVEIETECNELDLNTVGIHGRTPLMVAAAEGFLEVVQVLVQKGASVRATGHSHITALHEASANGEATVAKYLLSLGAEIDAKTADGVTPLMCAASWGNLEVAKLLLENRADPTKTDRSGATASDIAIEKNEHKTAELINSFKIHLHTNRNTRGTTEK